MWAIPAVVDGGAEFGKGAFGHFCDTFGIDVRYRTTQKPRGGAPIESLFGVTEDELINGLEGNSIQLKQARLISPTELPNERRRWKFDSLYLAFECYLFENRPTVVHAQLGITPLEYERIRLQETGEREHLTVNSFNKDNIEKYFGLSIWWHKDEELYERIRAKARAKHLGTTSR
ncbi:hypothetical protein [Paraburkholderia rhynchosiae]|uniref:Integrase catalytic domain-containing protein n=1 Tax=Paraburkholderia rhynchosiae TaxID=487049 RepID=A0A2N7WAF0_9BURK|nr:hypothetical protein [Paraburkholderia rhynchosiae]PMS26372.1 hypothetical protein C0Z16_27700 [Paraburkholderia rhynchosiae]CAB3728956.1 hypothetical protein LMG27174_05608 [Paraburkholderia rhynchosiae]